MTAKTIFDAIAPKYSALAKSRQYIGPAWLERALPATPIPTRAIDFACANGSLGHIVRTNFPKVHLTGVDVSPGMISEALRSGSYDELLVHDLNLPVPQVRSASVELAVALGFMEFLVEPAVFLAEASRVLAPGGTLLISFQEFWSVRETLAPRTTLGGPVPLHAHSGAEIAALLQSHSFRLHSLESTTGYVSESGTPRPYVMVRATRDPENPQARNRA